MVRKVGCGVSGTRGGWSVVQWIAAELVPSSVEQMLRYLIEAVDGVVGSGGGSMVRSSVDALSNVALGGGMCGVSRMGVVVCRGGVSHVLPCSVYEAVWNGLEPIRVGKLR